MRIRPLTEADAPFLERMMLLAGFPPDVPLPAGAESMPHVRRFVDGWGREGDVGVIAETDRPVGAAWARVLEGEPEVAIAVEPEARGAGIGAALLRALEDEAIAAGHRALTLTVSPRNPAVRLYERAGYEVVGPIMRRRLAP